MSTQTIGSVTYRVTLDESVAKPYEERASLYDEAIEAVLADQLKMFAAIDAVKPVTLSDSERQQVEKFLGRNFTTSTELVNAIGKSVTANVGGIPVVLTPFLIDKLRTRCIGMDFEKFLPMVLKKLLEEYVGLR